MYVVFETKSIKLQLITNFETVKFLSNKRNLEKNENLSLQLT